MNARGHRGERSPRRPGRAARRDGGRAEPAAAPPGAPATAPALAAAAAIAGPAAVAVTAIAMVAWTWRTWPDAIVDFGREVYLAWRLAAGDTLYVDARHFSGPLSPYVNAGWFRLFGPGVMTLALANLALAAGFVALLYGLLARLAGRLAATAACLLFVVTFGCSQYTIIGNYNWLCPYSHELTHGVMLVVAGLACVARYQDGRRVRWIAAAGLATGLVALTKAEVMLAGIPAIALGLGLTIVRERPDARRAGAIVAAFAAGVVAPLLATFAWFLPSMTPEEILAWPLGHWLAVARGGLAGSRFYREGMGTDDLPANLGEVATSGAAWAVFVGVAVAIGRSGLTHPIAVAASFGVGAAVGRLLSETFWLDTVARPLPLVMALLAGWAFVGFLRRREEPEGDTFALRTALAVFALGLLGKILLNVRFYQYGFVLAVPAAVVAVAALAEWLPAAVGRAGGHAPSVRAVFLGLLAAALVSHVTTAGALLARKVHVVGSGDDAFRADNRGVPVSRLLGEIRARVGPDETLLVFPEGAFVNYLARRRNPTPYYLFDSTTLALWAEADALAALAAAPPDWVAIVDRGQRGVRAKEILGWIREGYRPIWQDGPADFTTPRFSTMLMRRNPGS